MGCNCPHRQPWSSRAQGSPWSCSYSALSQSRPCSPGACSRSVDYSGTTSVPRAPGPSLPRWGWEGGHQGGRRWRTLSSAWLAPPRRESPPGSSPPASPPPPPPRPRSQRSRWGRSQGWGSRSRRGTPGGGDRRGWRQEVGGRRGGERRRRWSSRRARGGKQSTDNVEMRPKEEEQRAGWEQKGEEVEVEQEGAGRRWRLSWARLKLRSWFPRKIGLTNGRGEPGRPGEGEEGESVRDCVEETLCRTNCFGADSKQRQ